MQELVLACLRVRTDARATLLHLLASCRPDTFITTCLGVQHGHARSSYCLAPFHALSRSAALALCDPTPACSVP